MPSIKRLPNSQSLQWERTEAPDGTAIHATRVSGPPLRTALAPDQGAWSMGALEGLRSLGRPRAPRTVVTDDTLARMQRLEMMQQSVSALVPFRPNNVSCIVASDGEALVRQEMQMTVTEEPAAQYSRQAALDAVHWGTGVCDHINNVLFRAYVENERRGLRASMADRAMGRNAIKTAVPVMFAQNQDPHSFVLVGDPRDGRQARDVLVGDSWETLPIVKTWSNTAYNMAPYTIKMQAVPSMNAFADLSLGGLREESRSAVGRRDVDDHLRRNDAPPLGPALLESLYENCARHRVLLFDEISSATHLATTYSNAEGDRQHVPSISQHDYQAYRLTLSKAALYEKFKELT